MSLEAVRGTDFLEPGIGPRLVLDEHDPAAANGVAGGEIAPRDGHKETIRFELRDADLEIRVQHNLLDSGVLRRRRRTREGRLRGRRLLLYGRWKCFGLHRGIGEMHREIQVELVGGGAHDRLRQPRDNSTSRALISLSGSTS